MAKSTVDAERRLPLDFLDHTNNACKFDSYDAEFCFPSEFPYEFQVSSPTETDTSDEEEDFLAGLTRRLRLTHQQLPTANTRDLAGSPQSILSGIGSCSGRSSEYVNRSGLSRVPSTATFADSWEVIYAAGEVARLKIQNQKNKPVGPTSSNIFSNQVENGKKDGSVCGTEAKPKWLVQQQQLRVQNRVHELGYGTGKCNLPLSSVYPALQNHLGGSGSRVMLPGGSSVKRGCGGTGVFLPRHYETPSHSHNKTGCAPAMLPAKPVNALNSYVDDRNLFTQQQQRFSNAFASDYARRNALVMQRLNARREEAANCEIRLPQEWTY